MPIPLRPASCSRISHAIVQSSAYIPVTERKTRQRTPDALTDESCGRTTRSVNDSGGRRLDKQFYEKQLAWQKSKIEKTQKRLIDSTINKNAEAVPAQKMHKKINERVVDEKGAFMDRLDGYKERSDIKMKTLDAKYYGYSYAPKINEDFAPSGNKADKNIFKMGINEL